MKKTLKILSIILISIALFATFSQPVLAAPKSDEATDTKTASSIIDNLEGKGKGMSGEFDDVAGTIIQWLWGISIIVAVIVVMVIGIKFIIGSTQEKAEYKKSLIPLVVGVILVVFATTIVKFIYSIKG